MLSHVLCVSEKKTQLRGKLKLKMPRQGEGKNCKLQGEFWFACCMLHSAQHEIPYAHSEDAAPSTCGSHVAANGIHECACVCEQGRRDECIQQKFHS